MSALRLVEPGETMSADERTPEQRDRDAYTKGHQAGYRLALAKYHGQNAMVCLARCAYASCDVMVESTQLELEVLVTLARDAMHRKELWLAHCGGQHGHRPEEKR